jgi:hypothetical protein
MATIMLPQVWFGLNIRARFSAISAAANSIPRWQATDGGRRPDQLDFRAALTNWADVEELSRFDELEWPR